MTLSGRLITTTSGAPTLEDIARGLSVMPRFAGQTVLTWTVAHHSLVVMNIAIGEGYNDVYPLLPLHGLLHDAHESLTGDIPTSFKTSDMCSLQKYLDRRIYEDLGVPRPSVEESIMVKAFDRRALLAEAKVVTPDATYRRIAGPELHDHAIKDDIDDVRWALMRENVEDDYVWFANHFLRGMHDRENV